LDERSGIRSPAHSKTLTFALPYVLVLFMSDLPDDMAERHGRMLARLGEMALDLAEETYEAAKAAEDPAERERLKASFHRLSRSVRQTLALEARLERMRKRLVIDVERHEAEARQAAVKQRRSQVDASITRLIWTEAERADYGAFLQDLAKILNDEVHAEDFLEGPVEPLIARIKADLGFADEDEAPSPPPPGEGDREAVEGALALERRNSG